MKDDALKTARERAGLSQEGLADLSGVGVRTIRRIEGGWSPNVRTLERLAEALGVEVVSFFAHVPDAPTPAEPPSRAAA